jgi:Protein of unknown function (DUF3277)
MGTYSFKDVTATLSGPGGSINVGTDSGAAEEGITIEPVSDTNVMAIGADGSSSHSLSADTSRSIAIRLQKVSPVNAQLQEMMNFQSTSSAYHGKNTLTVRDVARGDLLVYEDVAFKRGPAKVFGKEAGNNEWQLDAGRSQEILGTGTPEV